MQEIEHTVSCQPRVHSIQLVSILCAYFLLELWALFTYYSFMNSNLWVKKKVIIANSLIAPWSADYSFAPNEEPLSETCFVLYIWKPSMSPPLQLNACPSQFWPSIIQEPMTFKWLHQQSLSHQRPLQLLRSTLLWMALLWNQMKQSAWGSYQQWVYLFRRYSWTPLSSPSVMLTVSLQYTPSSGLCVSYIFFVSVAMRNRCIQRTLVARDFRCSEVHSDGTTMLVLNMPLHCYLNFGWAILTIGWAWPPLAHPCLCLSWVLTFSVAAVVVCFTILPFQMVAKVSIYVHPLWTTD